MAHRGERVISRKAIAQGMSDVLRFTCMLMRALLVHVAHEIAGAARIRHSLRPLISRGRENKLQSSGALCREDAATYSTVIARFNRATQHSRDANDRTETPRR